MSVQIVITTDTAAQAAKELMMLTQAVAAVALRTAAPTVVQEVAAQNVEAANSTLVEGESGSSAPAQAAEAPAKKTRAKKAAGAPVAPAPEPEEVQSQDAQDEAEESAATATETYTHDSVRKVLGDYVKAYGMDAAQEDGAKVLNMLFGEGKGKISDIPDDQTALGKAVAGFEEMLKKNPYKRAKVG